MSAGAAQKAAEQDLAHMRAIRQRREQLEALKELFREYRSYEKPDATWYKTTVEELIDWAEVHR